MNPITISQTRLTKSVSSITIGFQQRHFMQRARFQTKTLHFFQREESSRRRWYSQQKNERILQGDLGFQDPTRNKLYGALAAGMVIVVVGGIYFTLNSDWFQDHLVFDEKDPTKWGSFMEFICIVGQLDRYSVDPEYTKKLLRGINHEDEEVRRICLSALATLATDRQFNAQIAESIDLPKILLSMRTARSVQLLAAVVDLAQILSQRGDNAPMLVNKQTLGVVELLCHHPKPEISSKVALMLENVSKNDEVSEYMIRLIPPMFELYKKVADDDSKKSLTIALRNILNSKAPDKYPAVYKQAIEKAKISQDQLQEFRCYTEESPVVYRLKCVTSALVTSAIYSSARWGIHGYRRGIREGELISLLKQKVPRSMIGAAALYLYFTADDATFTDVVEPNLNSEAALLGTFAISSVMLVGAIWASQALAPFSFIPSIIYPLYRYTQDGDKRYFVDTKKKKNE